MLKDPNPSHPGEILAEIYLQQLGWSYTQLADKLGCSAEQVEQIIGGKQPISADLAIDLEAVLGTEPQMWGRLQADFDVHAARQKRNKAQVR